MNLEELIKLHEKDGADGAERGVRSFIRAFLPEETGESEALWLDARERGIPVIRRDMKSLLRVLIRIKGPSRILEIGTAVGYSALFMQECLMAAGQRETVIDTIEKDEDRYREAKTHFEKAGGRIRPHLGDAVQVLQSLTGPYDFVFMDGAKAQNSAYLDRLMPLLRDGAVIVTDNILQEGAMEESRFISDKRDRTIHDRLRAYLFRLERPPFSTVLLSVGDGAAVSVYAKTEQPPENKNAGSMAEKGMRNGRYEKAGAPAAGGQSGKLKDGDPVWSGCGLSGRTDLQSSCHGG